MAEFEQLADSIRQSYVPRDMDRLREATRSLQPFSALVRRTESTQIADISVIGGQCVIHGLYKNQDVAIARVYISAGSRMQEHFHCEREVAGVESGAVVFLVDGDSIEVSRHFTIDIPPNVPHEVVAVEDSWLWVATMPASVDFPDGADVRPDRSEDKSRGTAGAGTAVPA